jgi:hypothetical protein
MSFGILDYYIEDPSPLQNLDLPTEIKPEVDPAIERFDFSLRKGSAGRPQAESSAEDEMQSIPLSPRPFKEEKSEPGRPQAKKYSLFPAVKGVMPSAHRLAQVINDSPMDSHQTTETTSGDQQTANWRPRLLSGAKLNSTQTPTPIRPRADTVSSSTPVTSPPTTTFTIPSPSYHPRNASLSFSNTFRLPSTNISSASVSSTRGSHRIPLRIFSTNSTATVNTTSHSSISTSPASTIAGQQKSLLSRWSEDTALASSTTTAIVLGCRSSFGSLMPGDIRSGEAYPACFFEDDEDVPLRSRKVRSGKGWRWWLCCGGRG